LVPNQGKDERGVKTGSRGPAGAGFARFCGEGLTDAVAVGCLDRPRPRKEPPMRWRHLSLLAPLFGLSLAAGCGHDHDDHRDHASRWDRDRRDGAVREDVIVIPARGVDARDTDWRERERREEWRRRHD
jgi:hypothetical protein